MLKKKMWRDIRQNKAQFLTIFIMVFLACFAFSGIHAYMDGMKTGGQNFYTKNNLQDLWVTKASFQQQDLEDIQNMDHVKNAEKLITLNTTLKDFDDVSLETYFIESNDISKMHVVDGQAFDVDKKGVWLDSYLADNLGLKVGDTISLKYESYTLKEKILGLVLVPDHVYSVKDDSQLFPTHNDYGFVYTSINEFPVDILYDEIAKEFGVSSGLVKTFFSEDDLKDYYPYNLIYVDVDAQKNVKTVKNEIQKTIDDVISVTDRDSSASYESYQSECEEGESYSTIFMALFVFIAMLSLMTTMNRFVKKQRTQIGTLKALGFKNRKILLHYLSYGFFISLIAAIIGTALGAYVVGNFFLDMEASYFEVPNMHIVVEPIVYIVSALIIVLIVLVTYASIRSVLKESASQALRLEAPKIKKANFGWTNKGVFKKLGLASKWNLRDISRNKLRTCMAVVGIAGCTMLIVAAFGFFDSFNAYFDWEFDVICNYEYKLSLNSNISKSAYNDLIDEYGENSTETVNIEYKLDDETKANILTINDSNGYVQITNHDKEPIELKDEGIFITEKLADQYDLHVGDNIEWHIFNDDTWFTSKIEGTVRDPQNQQFYMTKKSFEKLGKEYKPDSLYTNTDLSKVKSINGVEKIVSSQSQLENMSNMLNTMKSVIVLLIVIAVMLGVVIIYNLGILSFSEKQYQFATLKVLGFKYKQLKNIFILQNFWISIVAIVFGLPLGFYLVDYVFRYSIGDMYDFQAYISFITYIYAIVGTIVVSYVVNIFLARKLKKIDMVSSLKADE